MSNLVRCTAILLLTILFFSMACQQRVKERSEVYPLSDPSNKGGWVLNEELSDEFEGNKLDTTKWFIQGLNGEYYIWKGRAPAQYVPHNVIVEDGKLKIRTQWEPDYSFANEVYADGGISAVYGKADDREMPVTTAGVVTKKRFLYGYMEVKSKAADAAITSAFWGIGYQEELDVFEQMGKPKLKGKLRENTTMTTVHDWSPPAVRPTRVFQHVETLPFRVADDFHVYGAEWGVDYLKIYIDGKLIYSVTQDEVGTDWVLNNPMEIWLDSEIFKWLGYPDASELPADFEIEYVRVWQKPDDNLVDRAFLGFEGPILFQKNPRPLNLVPESSEINDYQKFWIIDGFSSKYLKIVKGEEYASGTKSLKFTGYGKNQKMEVEKAVALTPKGAINIPAGDFLLSIKVWVDQGRAPKKLYFAFTDPKLEIEPFDLTKVSRRQWVKIEKKISRTIASGPQDQLRIEIRREDLPPTKGAKIFIDEISVKPLK
ncbi:MAG: family 16 glycosylhydrolase [Caldisericaceae bacterium]|nr:family 16 glycosylhydrolase [Caldisericaceae bacterium]